MSLKEKIYSAFSNEALLPAGTDALYASTDALAQRLLDQLKQPDGQASEKLKSYCEAFLVQAIYNTNAIEGSSLTLEETAAVLDGQTVADKPTNYQFAVKGIAGAIGFLRQKAKDGAAVDEDFIKDTHAQVMLDIDASARGVYRNAPAHVMGSNMVPPQAIKIYGLMEDLLFAYNNSRFHPVYKATAFHVFFERIHPFSDGNGRTGRCILNYMLEQAGYPPISIGPDSKHSYLTALETWQVNGEVEPFIALANEVLQAELQARLDTITAG
jgi:Fic family protein